MTQNQVQRIKDADEVKILLDKCVTHMTPIREEDYNKARDAFQEKWGDYWANSVTR